MTGWCSMCVWHSGLFEQEERTNKQTNKQTANIQEFVITLRPQSLPCQEASQWVSQHANTVHQLCINWPVFPPSLLSSYHLTHHHPNNNSITHTSVVFNPVSWFCVKPNLYYNLWLDPVASTKDTDWTRARVDYLHCKLEILYLYP